MLINAIASPGGIAGVAIIWSAIALALVPLTWWASGPDRRYLTLIVATSPLYFPLVSAQIDGASNALVPVTVLLTLVLAVRSEILTTGLAGFLATQRFPDDFPHARNVGILPAKVLGRLHGPLGLRRGDGLLVSHLGGRISEPRLPQSAESPLILAQCLGSFPADQHAPVGRSPRGRASRSNARSTSGSSSLRSDLRSEQRPSRSWGSPC